MCMHVQMDTNTKVHEYSMNARWIESLLWEYYVYDLGN